MCKLILTPLHGERLAGCATPARSEELRRLLPVLFDIPKGAAPGYIGIWSASEATVHRRPGSRWMSEIARPICGS